MSENILITTTVSLDCNGPANQKVIHLVMGDYGTRALRLVPVDSGNLIRMEDAGVIEAKVLLACDGHESMAVECELGDTWATLVPTKNMTLTADEWNAQLCLYTSLEPEATVLKSAPFKINVHGTVNIGDMVEHTDSRITSISYDETTGAMTIKLRTGDIITATGSSYLYNAIRTALSDNLMSAQDRQDFTTIKGYLDQSVTTEASPTFAGATIGSVEIDAEGNISGARFT